MRPSPLDELPSSPRPPPSACDATPRSATSTTPHRNAQTLPPSATLPPASPHEPAPLRIATASRGGAQTSPQHSTTAHPAHRPAPRPCQHPRRLSPCPDDSSSPIALPDPYPNSARRRRKPQHHSPRHGTTERLRSDLLVDVRGAPVPTARSRASASALGSCPHGSLSASGELSPSCALRPRSHSPEEPYGSQPPTPRR